MATVDRYLRQRRRDHWLLGGDPSTFQNLVDQRTQSLKPWAGCGTILLAEADPTIFLASFLAACVRDCTIFLGNPNWAGEEWRWVLTQVQPDVIWAEIPLRHRLQGLLSNISQPRLPGNAATPAGLIAIPTGGSSGQIRFALHTWETLMAAVVGFQNHFQVETIQAYCVLPLYHVSGLMQVLRAFTSGGYCLIQDFSHLVGSNQPAIALSDFFISLVPTQLQRLLQQDCPWLDQFRTVLLGGGPAWPSLLTTARDRGISLAPTYGMTETAGQIATLPPQAFLQGDMSCGPILPHAQITIRSDDGQPLGPHQIGAIHITSTALALGYYPDPDQALTRGGLQSDDYGYWDDRGHLHLVGRRQDRMVTGGETVFAAEVEAALESTHLVADVGVIGLPDPYWGEAVTALYVPQQTTTGSTMLKAAIAPLLSRYKHPKHWIPVKELPRNPQGKLNRAWLREIAWTWLQDHTNGTTTELRLRARVSDNADGNQCRHGGLGPGPTLAD